MIKPICTTNTSHRGYRNVKINNKMQAEKLQRLIVTFFHIMVPYSFINIPLKDLI